MFQRASSAAARASASLWVTYTARWTPTFSGSAGFTSATTLSKSLRNSPMRSMGTPKPPVSTLKPRRTAASTESGLWAVIQIGGRGFWNACGKIVVSGIL